MSDSLNIQDLFASAREEAPSEATRQAVWGRVVVATSLPAALAGGSAPAAAKAAAGTKLLALGAVIGATSAAALALIVTSLLPGELRFGERAPGARARRAPASIASTQGVRLADVAPRVRYKTDVPIPMQVEPQPHDEPSAVDVNGDASSLSEEARLVTEARRALVRGDAERALALARRTHLLPTRALEPEELGLEARALQALGRMDEALAMELTLKQRYPSHALAR